MGNSPSVDCLRQLSAEEPLLYATNSEESTRFWRALFQSVETQIGNTGETHELFRSFVKNNSTTRNFSRLLIEVIKQLNEATTSAVAPTDLHESVQADQRLLISGCALLRSVVIYFILQCDEVTLQLHFSTKSEEKQNVSLIVPLLTCLIHFIINAPRDSEERKLLLNEVLGLLISLLSTQLHETTAQAGSGYSHLFYNELCQNAATLPLQGLLSALFGLVLDENLRTFQPSRSLFSTLASYSYAAYGMVFLESDDSATHPCNMSDRALLLILVLLAHPTPNLFHDALVTCRDGSLELPSSALGRTEPLVIPFDRLFDCILQMMNEPQAPGSALTLLAKMTQGNSLFLSYVLSRSELWQLVTGILEIIYAASSGLSRYTSDDLLLAVSILLLFSQDRAFISHSQHEHPPTVSWYKEQTLTDVSLADLLFIVILRALHCNSTRAKDYVMQLMGMATLVNLSSRFEKMSSHTAHRLLALLELLSKRYFKWKKHEQLKMVQQDVAVTTSRYQVNLYTKFLQMLFEVLNLCLFFGLSKNDNFIYALLYSKESFSRFAADSNFSQSVLNIQTVIEFFEVKLQRVDLSEYSNTSVMDAISKGQIDWKNAYFPHLVSEQRYRFSPLRNSAVFDVPHVWSIVVVALPYWNLRTIKSLPLFAEQHPLQFSSRFVRNELTPVSRAAVSSPAPATDILNV